MQPADQEPFALDPILVNSADQSLSLQSIREAELQATGNYQLLAHVDTLTSG